MLFEDVRQAALARLGEFTDKFPHGTQVPYRRIGVRQQELFSIAANENPEYAGMCATGDVVTGSINFSSMVPPVSTPERITRIEINALAGGYAGALVVGNEITVVPIADPDGIAPRATLRNGVLKGVAGELNDVTKVEVFYPYRPEPAAAGETGTRQVEVPDPYSELLVIDVARDYVRKALQLGEARGEILGLLTEEEEPLLAGWVAHVREYAPIVARFAKPPAAPVPRRAAPKGD